MTQLAGGLTVYAVEVVDTGEPFVVIEVDTEDGGTFTQSLSPAEARSIANSLCLMASKFDPVMN